MWKMLPLVNSEDEGEEFFAKWVDCQKGEIAKINPRKEKSCPKDALSLSSQQIFQPNTTAF
tara:strand:- start:517 stop:699 length:183 start_codon:yes stop_codon:yes gene_type:complete